MVLEVKLSGSEEDGFLPPICRDSILDDMLPLVVPRSRRRRRALLRRRRNMRPAQPAARTPRRDLAAADWLARSLLSRRK